MHVQLFSHAQLCETLKTVTGQAPLSVEFSRQEYWSKLPFSHPEDLPFPGTEHTSPVNPAMQADSSSLSHQ